MRTPPPGTDLLSALQKADLARMRSDYGPASSWYRTALTIDPHCFAAHCNLGSILRLQGRLEDAHEHLQAAVRICPKSAAAHNNLALVLSAQGKYSEAIDQYKEALRIRPDITDIHRGLGITLMNAGDLDAAEKSLRTAISLEPSNAGAHNFLGMVEYRRGNRQTAREAFCQAIRLDPAHQEAYYNLGNLLRDMNEIDEAVSLFQKAVELRPGHTEAISNLGEALQTIGRIDEAEAAYRRALRDNTGQASTIHSNLLFCMNYSPVHSPDTLFSEHRLWAEVHTATISPATAHDNSPDPDRRLRIGYVSPDFRTHPASFFLEPLLRAHDRTRFEIVCYSSVPQPDTRTTLFQSLADQWSDITGVDDSKCARRITDDGIDILVDCAGHCSGNRLLLFAHKPAPVQVSFLGYPNTTGMTAIDYRFTDDIADPPAETGYHNERLVRLADGFCCYAPLANAPETTPLPALHQGRITFGSLHTLARLNSGVIALWAQVLTAIPQSRLLIARTTITPRYSDHLLRQFSRLGIAPHRIDLRKEMPAEGHLALYREIDIALDTTPWSGHTTACEGLWMGVPTITLYGYRHASRMVASVLSRVGLTACVARSVAEYVEIAQRLGRDPSALNSLRLGLRETMLHSPLCNGSLYAQRVEEAYRVMWRDWCSGLRRK